MSDTLTPVNTESVFDILSKTRHDGSVYWSARELAALWQVHREWRTLFNDIQRYVVPVLSGVPGTHLETVTVSETVDHGSVEETVTRDDVRLSSLAVYTLLLSPSILRANVVAAQRYFAARMSAAIEQDDTQSPVLVPLFGTSAEPDVDPNQLTVTAYLTQKYGDRDRAHHAASQFGKVLREQHYAQRAYDPPVKATTINGKIIDAFYYTHADRALFDAAWDSFSRP